MIILENRVLNEDTYAIVEEDGNGSLMPLQINISFKLCIIIIHAIFLSFQN